MFGARGNNAKPIALKHRYQGEAEAGRMSVK